MGMSLTFVIDKVQGKARPRFTRTGHTYTDPKTKEYERQIAEAARKALGAGEMLLTPVCVVLDIHQAIPKSYSKKRIEELPSRPCKKPDIDNVFKAVADGIVGVLIKDDTQIVRMAANKRWGATDMVEVFVWEMLD